LQDICTILKYYNIPSEKCWTWINKSNVKVTDTNTNIFSKILKIIIRVVIILIAIFVLLVIIFAIKAKIQWQEEDQQNDTEE